MIYSRIRSILIGSLAIFLMLLSINLCFGQTTKTSAANVSPVLEKMMPDLTKADTPAKILPLFSPPIVKSDYLLLDAPQIAAAGTVSAHLKSELPGTELFILFNMRPATGEQPFLVDKVIPPLGKPDVSVNFKLTHDAELLLVVKANGKWYSASSDVRIAQKDHK